ncbi:hypothetical protein K8R66_00730 [bacterium]|nr:hypothetical protein [bacterium]
MIMVIICTGIFIESLMIILAEANGTMYSVDKRWEFIGKMMSTIKGNIITSLIVMLIISGIFFFFRQNKDALMLYYGSLALYVLVKFFVISFGRTFRI